MGIEAWITLAVLILVFVGLIRNRPPDAILLGAAVIVAAAGVVTPAQAFSGFSNEGMLTVAALFVVVAGLRETGALETLSTLALGRARTERAVFLRMSGAVTTMSAFLNNTPIVAMYIPVIHNWCRKHQVSPSRLLLPLSYLSILGGTCTLIGTSTNLVVNGLVIDHAARYTARHPEDPAAMDPIGLFELSWLGVPYALIGIAYLYFIGSRLLPDRSEPLADLERSAREYLVNFQVEAKCPLIGKTVEDAGLRRLSGLFLVEIMRDGQVVAPVGPNEVLREGDLLTFTGVVDDIVGLERIQGLAPVADLGYQDKDAWRQRRSLCEAVISATSPVINKTIRDADFRALYNAAVVAVHRGGQRLKGRVGDIELRAGDTLLLQSGPHFTRANRNNPDFYLVSGLEDTRPIRYEKAIIALGLLALLLVMMTAGVPPVMAAFLVAGAMIATRCVSVTDARQSVNWQTLVTIASAFGLGAALAESGLAATGARFVQNVAGELGPYAVLLGVYLMTSMITETVTNNAAAVLMFPFALEIADAMGIAPRPLIIAIAFAASASFVTPLGYQTNLMVAGPGGYRFIDFVRVGLPLNLLLMATATLLIPRIWAF